jgi:uncharacterized protein
MHWSVVRSTRPRLVRGSGRSQVAGSSRASVDDGESFRRVVRFHLATASGNVVTGLGPGWVRIGAIEYRENLVLTPETVATGWAPGFEGLLDAHFANLLSYRPEVVLFGAGSAIRFPHPRLTRALADAGIGLEVMDTAAACRTYNILAAEGRGVVAALLLTAADAA